MTATVLLTLGRLPKALEIARALASAGCRVIIAEPFRRHVCSPSRAVAKCFQVTAPSTCPASYQEDLLAIITREQVDIVVPVSEEAMHVAALAGRLPGHVRLASPGQPALLALHDKLQFARTAHAMGLDVPETFPANEPAAMALAAISDHVIKPVHSCSGIGVQYGRAGSILPVRSISASAAVQTLVRGRHVSSFTLAHEGRERVTVLYEGSVFSGSVAVCFQRVDDCANARNWISHFVSNTRYSGAISFDFIVDDSGRAWAIECNPRFTSGVHFVSPAGLAAALLDPSGRDRVELKPQQRFQQGYSTLTEVYAAVFRPKEFARRFGQMVRARDVVWQASDPMPFLMMTPNSWDILKPAMFGRMSLGEAATHDIVWTGPAAPPTIAPTLKVSPNVSAPGT